MPDDTRRASTESITTEFLELLAAEEKAGAKDESIPQTSTSEADESKPSDEKKDEKDQSSQEQSEIMSQEDIEALITNGMQDKALETPEDVPEKSNNPKEVLSKTDIQEMFEEQSSAVTKPETENQSQETTDSHNITNQDEAIENPDPESSVESNSLKNNPTEETNPESSDASQGSSEDDLEAIIKKKKAQQQQAKSDLSEIDIAALFNNEANRNAGNPADPTSVLSRDDFSEKENIIDNEANIINSQNVLENLLSKTQGELADPDNSEGILSNDQVSEMLQSSHKAVSNSSDNEKQSNDPFTEQASSIHSEKQFPAANKVEKKKQETLA